MPHQDPTKRGFAPVDQDFDRVAGCGPDDGFPDEEDGRVKDEEDDEEFELPDELTFPADAEDDR